MRYRKAASAALMVACMFGAATVTATAAAHPRTTSSEATAVSAVLTQTAVNPVDAEFVSMMIPHHYQALIMSRMVPERSANEDLRALARRIDIEQSVEIGSMQAWQNWNGLEVTDPQEAYEALLDDPMHLEHMGMATPEELEDLSAAEGTAFDVLFLQLMIEHHQGAVDMATDVLINGSDAVLQQMATDMLTTQYTQILQMEAMLADMTS